MTTLAIIGGGIAGRSLTYALAKKQNSYAKIILVNSDQFAPACSLRSTAIVAPRGISAGHSDLGDLLLASFKTFKNHVELEKPQGVFPITQTTFAISKIESFKKRYPDFTVRDDVYTAAEKAFLIDTKLYLEWLIKESFPLSIEMRNDFVTHIDPQEGRVDLKIQTGESFSVDKLIMSGGSYNRYWRPLSASRALGASTAVQGCYLEFLNVNYGAESFSITFEGDNFIYHAHTHKLLIGSTTHTLSHVCPPVKELTEIYFRLRQKLHYDFPEFNIGKILVGQREKSSQRRPYLIHEGPISWLGGFYKNGYSLALHMAQKMVEEL